jgi:hypothetical protein
VLQRLRRTACRRSGRVIAGARGEVLWRLQEPSSRRARKGHRGDNGVLWRLRRTASRRPPGARRGALGARRTRHLDASRGRSRNPWRESLCGPVRGSSWDPGRGRAGARGWVVREPVQGSSRAQRRVGAGLVEESSLSPSTDLSGACRGVVEGPSTGLPAAHRGVVARPAEGVLSTPADGRLQASSRGHRGTCGRGRRGVRRVVRACRCGTVEGLSRLPAEGLALTVSRVVAAESRGLV